MNTISNELAFGLGLLLIIVPLVFFVGWLFRTNKSSLQIAHGIGSGITLSALITFAYCLFFFLLGHFSSEIIRTNAAVISIIGYATIIACYLALVALFIFIAAVIIMGLTQLLGWAREQRTWVKK